jgi:hypothetical protein
VKSKQLSSSSRTFVRGGSNKMLPKKGAGTQTPGQTAQLGSGGGKFAKGGSTKMVGKQSASPAKAC